MTLQIESSPRMILARSLIFTAAFYTVTALFLVVGSPLLLAPRSWAMVGLRLHAMTCLWLLRELVGASIEVRGRDKLPDGPFLIAAKHQSAWDTFALVPLFRDPAIVLKAELGYIPFYGWFCRKFEHILVRRDRAAIALKALVADARDRAERGREILIFPEGTRQAPGAAPDYKPGVVALYDSLALPCVPVALNSGLYWPRRSLMRYPGRIVVEILDPLPAGLDRRTFRAELVRRIEEASSRLIDEAAASATPPPLIADSAQRTAS